jgi:hypothetical protein
VLKTQERLVHVAGDDPIHRSPLSRGRRPYSRMPPAPHGPRSRTRAARRVKKAGQRDAAPDSPAEHAATSNCAH